MNFNDEEKIFIGKIDQVVRLLDEIDELGNDSSDYQSVSDSTNADYLHLIENRYDDMSNECMIQIIKNLKDVQDIRRSKKSIVQLYGYFTQNSKQLLNKNSRQIFRSKFGDRIKCLHNDYKYNVLTDKDIIDMLNKKPINNNIDDVKKQRYGISKEELQECIDNKMKNNDIAKQFNKTPSYISHLKKYYGIGTRKYNKK